MAITGGDTTNTASMGGVDTVIVCIAAIIGAVIMVIATNGADQITNDLQNIQTS
jgi:hypothetical protein